MATITKRPKMDGSVSWRAQIRIERKGKIAYQETRNFHLKHNAEVWAVARETELETPGVLEKASKRGVTLGQLLGAYMDDTGVRMSRTKRFHLTFLQGTSLAQVDLSQLTQSQIIEHVRDRIEGGTQPATVNNDLVWLRTVARWAQPFDEYQVSVEEIESALVYCQRRGYISRTQSRERRPTTDELWRLSEYFNGPENRTNLPMQDIIWFAVHSARRLAEITRLLWSDNDYDERSGLVRDLKQPQQEADNKARFKYTTEAWEIIQRQPRNELRIFPYTSKSVGSAFTHACHLLGIHDLRFQDLRHEATSRLFEAGYSIPEIEQITLIRDWNTLGRYTHLNATDTPARMGMKTT